MKATRSTSPGNKDDRYVAIREFLVKRRLQLGISQRAVGERLGLGQQFVSKVEQGERRLDVVEFADYVRALGLEPSDVIALIPHTVNGQRLL